MEQRKIYHSIPAGRNNFHSAILTTYSFNFHHFEYQVLKTLKQKSIYNVGVLVDANMLDKALGVSSAGLKQLTQSYSINGVYAKGAFHPKLNFLIGEDHLLLVFGSGNITAGGHGKNHETFSAIYADNKDSSLVPALNEAWYYLQDISASIGGYSKNRIEKVIPKNCSLINKRPQLKHQYYKVDNDLELALIYNDDTSILNQIISLVPNENINAISIVSPYYDEDGSLLLTLKEQYPDAILNIFLSEDKGLPPVNMVEDDRINFFKWESTKRGQIQIKSSEDYERKLHSKLFFFHSPKIEYCLIGSANATKAAFGSLDKRGLNDEFGMLYKSSTIDFLKELGIVGNKEKTHLKNFKRDPLVDKSAPITERIPKYVKIKSCDLNGLTLKILCVFKDNFKNASVCVYDDSGNIIHQNQKVLISEEITTRLNSSEFEKSPAYVLIKDENDKVISNKQVINNIDELYNTDPSKENRAVRSIRSALEMGQINEYKLLGYLNELNDIKSKTKKTVQSAAVTETDKKKEEAHSEMTFEQAMAMSKNKRQGLQLSTKHNAVQFWQTITSLLKERREMSSEDLNDEEEDANVSKSNERKTSDLDDDLFEIKNDKEFKSILKKTEQMTDYFVRILNRISKDKSYEINEVLLCQFLLITHIITVIHQFNSYDLPYDEKKKEYKVYTPQMWSKILNDQYITMMKKIIINFSRVVLSNSLVKIEDDDYRLKNFETYKQEVVSNMIIYHYLVNRNTSQNPLSEILDLSFLNVRDKFDLLNEGFEERMETLSKSKTTDLFNVSGVLRLKYRLDELHAKIKIKEGIFHHKYEDPSKLTYGICLVKKEDDKKIYFKSILDHEVISHITKKEWNNL